jgi:acyl-CoA dehydrogenase
VDANTNGIRVGPKNRKMGQQGAHVRDVVFGDCCSEAASLGGAASLNKAFLTAMKTLDRGRLHISALAVGAERLIGDSLNYARAKTVRRRIAQFQPFKRCSPTAELRRTQRVAWC